jgi:hypothetical protein
MAWHGTPPPRTVIAPSITRGSLEKDGVSDAEYRDEGLTHDAGRIWTPLGTMPSYARCQSAIKSLRARATISVLRVAGAASVRCRYHSARRSAHKRGRPIGRSGQVGRSWWPLNFGRWVRISPALVQCKAVRNKTAIQLGNRPSAAMPMPSPGHARPSLRSLPSQEKLAQPTIGEAMITLTDEERHFLLTLLHNAANCARRTQRHPDREHHAQA